VIITSIDQVRDLVRKERKRRGLTQAQAAELIGHTQKWLSNFESGKVDPPASMVFRLMNLLGMPLQQGEAQTARKQPGKGVESEIGLDLDL